MIKVVLPNETALTALPEKGGVARRQVVETLAKYLTGDIVGIKAERGQIIDGYVIKEEVLQSVYKKSFSDGTASTSQEQAEKLIRHWMKIEPHQTVGSSWKELNIRICQELEKALKVLQSEDESLKIERRKDTKPHNPALPKQRVSASGKKRQPTVKPTPPDEKPILKFQLPQGSALVGPQVAQLTKGEKTPEAVDEYLMTQFVNALIGKKQYCGILIPESAIVLIHSKMFPAGSIYHIKPENISETPKEKLATQIINQAKRSIGQLDAENTRKVAISLVSFLKHHIDALSSCDEYAIEVEELTEFYGLQKAPKKASKDPTAIGAKRGGTGSTSRASTDPSATPQRTKPLTVHLPDGDLQELDYKISSYRGHLLDEAVTGLLVKALCGTEKYFGIQLSEGVLPIVCREVLKTGPMKDMNYEGLDRSAIARELIEYYKQDFGMMTLTAENSAQFIREFTIKLRDVVKEINRQNPNTFDIRKSTTITPPQFSRASKSDPRSAAKGDSRSRQPKPSAQENTTPLIYVTNSRVINQVEAQFQEKYNSYLASTSTLDPFITDRLIKALSGQESFLGIWVNPAAIRTLYETLDNAEISKDRINTTPPITLAEEFLRAWKNGSELESGKFEPEKLMTSFQAFRNHLMVTAKTAKITWHQIRMEDTPEKSQTIASPGTQPERRVRFEEPQTAHTEKDIPDPEYIAERDTPPDLVDYMQGHPDVDYDQSTIRGKPEIRNPAHVETSSHLDESLMDQHAVSYPPHTPPNQMQSVMGTCPLKSTGLFIVPSDDHPALALTAKEKSHVKPKKAPTIPQLKTRKYRTHKAELKARISSFGKPIFELVDLMIHGGNGFVLSPDILIALINEKLGDGKPPIDFLSSDLLNDEHQAMFECLVSQYLMDHVIAPHAAEWGLPNKNNQRLWLRQLYTCLQEAHSKYNLKAESEGALKFPPLKRALRDPVFTRKSLQVEKGSTSVHDYLMQPETMSRTKSRASISKTGDTYHLKLLPNAFGPDRLKITPSKLAAEMAKNFLESRGGISVPMPLLDALLTGEYPDIPITGDSPEAVAERRKVLLTHYFSIKIAAFLKIKKDQFGNQIKLPWNEHIEKKLVFTFLIAFTKERKRQKPIGAFHHLILKVQDAMIRDLDHHLPVTHKRSLPNDSVHLESNNVDAGLRVQLDKPLEKLRVEGHDNRNPLVDDSIAKSDEINEWIQSSSTLRTRSAAEGVVISKEAHLGTNVFTSKGIFFIPSLQHHNLLASPGNEFLPRVKSPGKVPKLKKVNPNDLKACINARINAYGNTVEWMVDSLVRGARGFAISPDVLSELFSIELNKDPSTLNPHLLRGERRPLSIAAFDYVIEKVIKPNLTELPYPKFENSHFWLRKLAETLKASAENISPRISESALSLPSPQEVDQDYLFPRDHLEFATPQTTSPGFVGSGCTRDESQSLPPQSELENYVVRFMTGKIADEKDIVPSNLAENLAYYVIQSKKGCSIPLSILDRFLLNQYPQASITGSNKKESNTVRLRLLNHYFGTRLCALLNIQPNGYTSTYSLGTNSAGKYRGYIEQLGQILIHDIDQAIPTNRKLSNPISVPTIHKETKKELDGYLTGFQALSPRTTFGRLRKDQHVVACQTRRQRTIELPEDWAQDTSLGLSAMTDHLIFRSTGGDMGYGNSLAVTLPSYNEIAQKTEIHPSQEINALCKHILDGTGNYFLPPAILNNLLTALNDGESISWTDDVTSRQLAIDTLKTLITPIFCKASGIPEDRLNTTQKLESHEERGVVAVFIPILCACPSLLSAPIPWSRIDPTEHRQRLMSQIHVELINAILGVTPARKASYDIGLSHCATNTLDEIFSAAESQIAPPPPPRRRRDKTSDAFSPSERRHDVEAFHRSAAPPPSMEQGGLSTPDPESFSDPDGNAFHLDAVPPPLWDSSDPQWGSNAPEFHNQGGLPPPRQNRAGRTRALPPINTSNLIELGISHSSGDNPDPLTVTQAESMLTSVAGTRYRVKAEPQEKNWRRRRKPTSWRVSGVEALDTSRVWETIVRENPSAVFHPLNVNMPGDDALYGHAVEHAGKLAAGGYPKDKAVYVNYHLDKLPPSLAMFIADVSFRVIAQLQFGLSPELSNSTVNALMAYVGPDKILLGGCLNLIAQSVDRANILTDRFVAPTSVDRYLESMKTLCKENGLDTSFQARQEVALSSKNFLDRTPDARQINSPVIEIGGRPPYPVAPKYMTPEHRARFNIPLDDTHPGPDVRIRRPVNGEHTADLSLHSRWGNLRDEAMDTFSGPQGASHPLFDEDDRLSEMHADPLRFSSTNSDQVSYKAHSYPQNLHDENPQHGMDSDPGKTSRGRHRLGRSDSNSQ